MIEQKWIDVLTKQKEELLKKKESLNFFSRWFFRKNTDWILTDEVNSYTRQEYLNDPWNHTREPIGEPKIIQKQTQLRMNLETGEIEVYHFEV